MTPTPDRDDGLLGRLFPERTLMLRSRAGLHITHLGSSAQAALCAGAVLLCVWSVVATGLAVVNAVEQSGAAPFGVATVAFAPPADVAHEIAAQRDAARAQAQAAIAELASRHDALIDMTVAREALVAEAAGLRARAAALAERAADAERAAHARDAALQQAMAEGRAAARERDELAYTLQNLSVALDQTAVARDDAEAQAEEIVTALGALEAGVEQERGRQADLLNRIEKAAELSILPLQSMLSSAGVNVERIIEELRRETGAGGSGGPFVPAVADAGAAPDQAAAVMADLEQVRLLHIAAKRMPFAAPVRAPRFTSGFGVRRDPFNRRLARHDGLDMSGPVGTPILAPADGQVVFAGVQRGYGRMVKIRHHFGFETVYAHLSKVRVSVGQPVRRGARVGDMGSTGRSTGSHLHYEIHVDGKPVNPRKFIEAARNVL